MTAMQIVESPALVEQFRFPKSRRARIRKKWARDKRNWRAMRKFLSYGNGIIFAHPEMAARLRRHVRTDTALDPAP